MTAAGHTTSVLERATATLYGLAMGDALGMPSQTLSRQSIRQHYGEITDFVAPHPGHPVSEGLTPAQVTDDTEQALLLARRLIAFPGSFDATGWAQDLLDWEEGVRARGLLDLLGPSSKAALEAIRRGADPAEAAKAGTTNGAAMRIAPIGLLCRSDDLPLLVDRVEQTCRVTHNTGEAIAAASAVACFISARIGGAEGDTALSLALHAAKLGQRRGYPNGHVDIAGQIETALHLASRDVTPDQFAEAVGTSVASHESVPAAFGVMHLAGGDVWRAGLLAANLGDDTDTIGAIACAMCGAAEGPSALPPAKLAALRSANMLDIEPLAAGLIALRQGTAQRQREEIT